MSVAAPHPLPRVSGEPCSRTTELLSENLAVVGAIAAWTALFWLSLPQLLTQDSWLAFVDGRLIAASGLPHADSLTAWTLGRAWTDQQWGAHLLLYELADHLGVRGAVAFDVLVLASTFTALAFVARRLGGSARMTAVAVCVPVLAAPWLVQLRTQTTALLPFVAVYALLCFDSKGVSRRALLVVPVLVVWANLHGSVALGAGLVCLYGLSRLGRPPGRAGALLLAAAPAALLISPYGLDLVGYYRLMLFRPPLARFVDEWAPPSPSAVTAAYFATLALALVLYLRRGRRLTTFERWALPLLAVASLTAVRNAMWFELALAIALPRLLPGRDRPLPTSVMRVRAVAALCAVAAVAAVGAVESRSDASLEPDDVAAAVVARAAGPDGIVLADDRHADWLLWREPRLEGRVAYDVRFELFGARELTRLRALHDRDSAAWAACGTRVATFAGTSDLRQARRAGVARGAVLYESSTFAVVRRASRHACSW